MKYTLFIAMLAAAAGSQVFADETVKTEIQNASYNEGAAGYVGALGHNSDATGGNVSIVEGGDADLSESSVYGGYADGDYAVYGNMVTMDSGKVGTINGGSAVDGNGSAHNNTVIVRGGTPQAINGGVGANGGSYDNVVIVMGGSTGNIYGGVSYSGISYHNQIHLVGKSAALTLKDAQDNDVECTGSADGITVGHVVAGSPDTGSYGNTIDIYGYGLQASSLRSMAALTFHLIGEQMSAADACITLSSTTAKYALNFTEAILQIKALDVQDWTPGTTITLVQSELEIQGLNNGELVDITNADGTQVLTQGKLLLTNGAEGTHLLKLTIPAVPEPTTGTLGLLALAGLCARRRRK